MDIAERYAVIKHWATLLRRNDVHFYSALKANFIEHQLRLALTALDRVYVLFLG